MTEDDDLTIMQQSLAQFLATADRAQWAESRVQALMDAGVSQADAERSVQWVLDNLPPGADIATWIPPASLLDEQITEADMEDAAEAWRKRAPPRWRKLLDARPVDG